LPCSFLGLWGSTFPREYEFGFRKKVYGLDGGRRRKAPICDDDSIELSILSRRRPLKSAAGAVAVVRGEAGEWAGLVSPGGRGRGSSVV